MSVGNGRECGENTAAYVLGALTPSEAEAFRRHVADCAACRAEVASFEQITAALPDAGEQAEVPRELRRRVMREVRATPKPGSTRPRVEVARSWRPLTAWGGALAAVIVAVLVAVALSSGGSSATRVVQASVGNAELKIAGGRADLVVHRLPQLPAGRIYEMWVQRGSAQPAPTGTLFAVSRAGSAAVGVPGNLNGVSRVMVTQEAAGGTLAPTSAPVIVAPVS
jgi:anti-sigma-K factor RskA